MSYEIVKNNVTQKKATLVAVSKTKTIETIQDIYNKGQRHFGENRVQELTGKYEALPKDIKWHQIGSLQNNKVKYIAPFVHLIHSVDSKKLLNTIIKEAQKNNRPLDILLQLKIAQEESKHGFSHADIFEILEYLQELNSDYIRVRGLMGMASFTSDMEKVKEEFLSIKKLFEEIKSKEISVIQDFNILSMGMSSDYEIALECGSTMVRVGSLIFGPR